MVITVHCPSCATSFPVDPAKVPEGGVNARCSVCTAIFRVDVDAQEEPIPIHEFEPPATTVAPPEEELPQEAGPEAKTAEPPMAEQAPPEEPAAADGVSEEAAAEDWIFETEQEVDTSGLDIEPMGTVESTIEEAREEVEEETESFAEEAEPLVEGLPGLETGPAFPDPTGLVEETSPEPTFELAASEEAPEGVDTFEAPPEPEAAPEPTLEAPPEPEAAFEPTLEAAPEPESSTEKSRGFSFGHRDPHDKARRLARVLVSDMIMYNPDRHERALAGGTLKEDFEDEIAKSWREYVDQVGDEIANGTSYWSDALNEVLAKGERVF